MGSRASRPPGRAGRRGIEPIEGLVRQPPHLPQGMGLGNRSSVEMKENRGPVRSCWPRMRSVPLGHSHAAGLVFQQPPKPCKQRFGLTLH